MPNSAQLANFIEQENTKDRLRQALTVQATELAKSSLTSTFALPSRPANYHVKATSSYVPLKNSLVKTP